MKGENNELGTKGRSASSVLASSVTLYWLGACSHHENFEYDFWHEFMWTTCYLLPFYILHPPRSDGFQEKRSVLWARFTRSTPKAETCLSLQLASLDLSVIQSTFTTVRYIAAAKPGWPLPIDCSCIQPRASPCVPLPPAILSMSHTSVSELGIRADWWERTTTLLQQLP